jgi:Cu(I)/Ag(I) efflux system membrane protein CusA/SilA
MHAQGINANIMSLGGIAIAIGAMVDAAIVMIENAHRKLEALGDRRQAEGDSHWRTIEEAAVEVGPGAFLQPARDHAFLRADLHARGAGRTPLLAARVHEVVCDGGGRGNFGDTRAGADGLSHTRPDSARGIEPINRALIAIYRPMLEWVLRSPWITIGIAAVVVLLTAWPLSRLGGEFLPPLDEGDLLYMPSALPGLSAGKASEILQRTDRLIRQVPEVSRVFGKIGRAETATDPAPLEMVETTIQFKPRSEWRPGMTTEKLIEELDRTVRLPGLANLWIPPIRNRIDMLATGIKSPVGIKVSGADLAEVDRIATDIERTVKNVPGVTSALAERLTGGRYVDIAIDRRAAARYGLNVSDVQSIVTTAIGGETIGETVEGLQRFPISVRYPREMRDSVEKLRELPVVTERGAQIALGAIADIRIADGPPMLKSENARPSGWVYVDLRGRDLRSAVTDMQAAVARDVKLSAGYSITWSGQFEYLERATARLKAVVPRRSRSSSCCSTSRSAARRSAPDPGVRCRSPLVGRVLAALCAESMRSRSRAPSAS